MRKAGHNVLEKAKAGKNDEFYTQLVDIERELQYYSQHFENKVIFCNCDDVRTSNFFKYFVSNFHNLKIRKLICSCFKKSERTLLNLDVKDERGFYYEFTGNQTHMPTIKDVTFFENNGDFRSKECIALLKDSDIIVTNPPFSLFREYVSQLIRYDKKFIIIGNINCITYKDIFKLIKENKVWLGINLGRGISGFVVPDDYDLYGLETSINDVGDKIISPNNCLWLTNLDNIKRHEYIKLTKTYFGHESEYPPFDNYKGINVNRTEDIPLDYNGTMGVPITFLHKFNPDQFEIIKFRKGDDDKDLTVRGKQIYFRILIKNKQNHISGDLP